jgi:RHH-type proline utilization regulon transcriptional repressor/proline dehydrogenase/delta 1-pyrroline-5-carboxylate dehydrogenase
MNRKSLEAATRRIGEEIFQRAEAAGPSVFSIEFWQQQAMDWMTQDEDLKMRLFRFVEVLPSLRSGRAVARHLAEYLKPRNGSRRPLSPLLQFALAYRRDDSWFASLVVDAARFGCSRMAKQFIAGATPEEAIATVVRLRGQGMTFTLDVLGETVIADRVARAHQQLYLDLIIELSRGARTWEPEPLLDHAPWGVLPRVNISLKLSAIVTKFDPIDPPATSHAVLDRLRPILRAARDTGSFLNIDMEHTAVKGLTLDIYKRVLSEPEFRDWADCGIVIQCYLPDGERDMADLIDWARRRGTPVTVRLVKGAYWDSETANALLNGWPIPVFTRKWQSDVAFETVAKMMLENADIIRPAFASHNVRSIAAVLAMEEALGLPPRTVEMQMLTGMGNPLKRAMVAMNQRLRVYAPCGDQMTGMAYFIRRLIENTANESFLRQTFSERTPVHTLLQDPAEHHPGPQTPLPRPFIQDIDETAEMKPFTNEADVDFSHAENRQAMEAALRSVRNQFGREVPAIIDNTPVPTTEWFESRNPSDPREVVGRTAMCDSTIADRAVAAARGATEAWASAPAEERAAVLDRAADLLHDRRFEAAAWMVYEAGKTWREAQGDLMETADYLRFYAREARHLFRRTRRRDYPGEMNEYTYRPRGVVVTIGPFCFPMALLTGMTAAALVTGNTVIAKPARGASLCAAKIVDILIEAGLPPGVLNLVPGRGADVGDTLVNHPGVAMIAFTGSRDVGCRIIENTRRLPAGQTAFKHVIAEMGGSNAIIVDDDADLDEAVQATIASAFGYSGQKCTACSRAIVLKNVHDDYLAKLIEAAGDIRPAAADLPATTVGPLIDADALDRAKCFVEAGKEEAHCVLEGRTSGVDDDKRATGGYFFSPVIFADVSPDARIAQKEIMAPVLAVIRADHFAHAIDIANNVCYAMTGGVYSRSPTNIELAKRRLQVGNLYVNRRITASRVDRQPFGGFKLSGLGTKTGGPDYLQQFAIPRTVSENTMRHGFAPTGIRLTIDD